MAAPGHSHNIQGKALGSPAALPPTIPPRLPVLILIHLFRSTCFQAGWRVLACSLHQRSRDQLARALPPQGLQPSTCSLPLRSLQGWGRRRGQGRPCCARRPSCCTERMREASRKCSCTPQCGLVSLTSGPRQVRQGTPIQTETKRRCHKWEGKGQK